MDNKKKIMIGVVLAGLAGLGIWFWKRSKKEDLAVELTPSGEIIPKSNAVIPFSTGMNLQKPVGAVAKAGDVQITKTGTDTYKAEQKTLDINSVSLGKRIRPAKKGEIVGQAVVTKSLGGVDYVVYQSGKNPVGFPILELVDKSYTNIS